MNPAQAFLASLRNGMDIVQSVGELPAHAAGPDTSLEMLRGLHDTFFGNTPYSRKQRAAIAAARDNEQSLVALKIIDKAARQVKNSRAGWDLRVQLCGLKVSESALQKAANKAVKELRTPRKKQPGVSVRRSANDLWDLTLTGNSRDIADMHNAVGESFASAKEFFFGPDTARRSTLVTNVIIPLDKLTTVISGDGDETTVQLTNGARITGAQLVTEALAEHGMATLVHPLSGPVNQYRLSRFANQKQRLMALAENPTCAWPGCNTPGEQSQMHHITEWVHGGETNADNLCTLCAFHNGVNGHAQFGRMRRHDGKTEWLPPWAYQI